MKNFHILLVEDNEGDILLTKDALDNSGMDVTLSVVKDGKEALDFLNKERTYQSVCSPDMMLLDINLPKKNGHEVLQYVKGKDSLKHIPVIILTSSSSKTDIDLSYQNHANCYIVKPDESSVFMEAIRKLEDFWMSTVSLPLNTCGLK
jgi:CheY-like chemotaxis protein